MLSPHRLSLAFFLLASGVGLVASNVSPAPPIDFSHAGYGGGGVPLPEVPARIHVEPRDGDDTLAIQGAIDAAAKLPLDERGFRGAVLLRPGTYQVADSLKIMASGIVLRGQDATIVATGNSRRTLIVIKGDTARRTMGTAIPLAQGAPAGAQDLKLANTNGFAPGTRVLIRRPSTQSWIELLGMNQFTGAFKDARLDWWEGSRDLEWDRTVVSTEPATGTLRLDAPITTDLDPQFGGGTVQTIDWPDRLRQVGIENLTCISDFDTNHPADEEHAWLCISIDHAEDAWVRGVTSRHFVSAAVCIGAGGKRISVIDTHSEKPISEIGGWRRHAFYSRGQQVLFLRCRAGQAREAFAAGFCSPGPNVFLDCVATEALADSGSFESWASGALFENVSIDGAGLTLSNLGARWQGAGWNAANSVLWNCQAKTLRVDSPPGAPNLLHSPQKSGRPGKPLYAAQLKARLGAAALAALALDPNRPLPETAATIAAPAAVSPAVPPTRHLALSNGVFTLDGQPFFAAASSNAWWKGQTVPFRAATLGYHPMRWAPGLEGPGMTEDLEALARRLKRSHVGLVHVWSGLWYDRRRDDHRTDMRADAEVWAPFYELPWARSGRGVAADGLSTYDLERFNPWYFSRLRQFTRLAAREGLVIYHHFYNHHNLVEAAAHWAEFPWRAANCLQETGFAEPPSYENNGKRIGIVAEFYDTTHPVRRDLHRRYIRHCLDVLKEEGNVIHTLGFQFAGPESFQRFFLETVAEWRKETGATVHLALNTSKTITDAILADARLAPLVDIIDQRYWQYLPDGALFAPHSDGKRAFREQRVEAFKNDSVPQGTAELVYRQVREYRDRFPQKGIIAPHAGQGPLPILLAKGSYALTTDYAASQPLKTGRDDAALYTFLAEKVGSALVPLRTMEGLPTGLWGLTHDGRFLLYSAAGDAIAKPSSTLGKRARGWWLNPRDGKVEALVWTDEAVIRKPSDAGWLLWFESLP